VWTPKRIVLLVAGFAVFFAAYYLYASTYLGHLDSLPPLPEGFGPRKEKVTCTEQISCGSVSALVLERNAFLRAAAVRHFLTPRTQRARPIDLKLEQAFGTGCPELRRAYKLDLLPRSMLVSAESCNFINGTIQLAPVSLALFGKSRNDGKGVEINTISANSATLTFDRPVNSPNEISGRKIVEAELRNNIVIVNNRRTASRADDLEVYITQGTLHYVEPKHLVWTKDNVELKDKQSQPDPIKIEGEGMEMELITEPSPARPGDPAVAKNKNEQITGVKRIQLHANVYMNLYTAGNSGVMGGKRPGPAPAAARDAKVAAPQPASALREHVYIHTDGPFRYDFFKDYDLAQFDVPAGGAGVPQPVHVMRDHSKNGPIDQLICQHLELHLRHRDSPPPGQAARPAGVDAPDQSLEIETVYATGRGQEVLLISDAEHLEAHGADFFHDAVKKITVLKGQPEITVFKDGTLLHAREMTMHEVKAPPQRGHPPEMFQEVLALGPGSIHMGAKDKERKKHTTHAYWRDVLTSTRDGPDDKLILKGNARFVDDEHEQSLQGETLTVWLLPEENKPSQPADKGKAPKRPETAKTTDASSEHGRKPRRIEADKAVVARAKEMFVHDTERLVLQFEDVPELHSAPAAEGPPPAAPAAKPAAPSPAAPMPPATRQPPGPLAPPPPPGAGRAGPPSATPPPPAKQPPPRPFDLSARVVHVWALRAGERTQLKEMQTSGNVHVRQEPARPDERPVDVRGSTLSLTYRPDGNFLVVSGEEGEGPNDLAQLQMDKIYIIGPTVNIDQRDNLVWVDGVGAMQMESATNFQGAKLDHPTPLTVHWTKNMLFDGISSEFTGNIQAEQQSSRLACQRLQVFFDHAISLKDGHQGDQPAKVRTLTCSKRVRVEDVTYAGEQMEKYQLIKGEELEMRTVKPEDEGPPSRTPPAEGNEVDVVGPGDVRILQRGGIDSTTGPGNGPRTDAGGRREVVGKPTTLVRGEPPSRRPPQRGGGQSDELTMTYVHFGQRMLANSKTNKASFYEAVEVLHFPWDPAHPLHEEFDIMEIRSRELPPGWMYLRCNRLVVVDQKEGGISHQQMEANVRVYARTSEFAAEASRMTYDQQKDLVVFYGTDSAPARFTKYGGKGTTLNEFTGRTIAYSRSTGKCQVDGLDRYFGH
jgi:lipopolysaccharide export system protein LptA